MGRRREEKVDEEYLAQLMRTESGSEKIRVKMPNTKVNEMFAIVQAILGGRRVTVLCADGETRMARIPGKMRRRQWVRDGDLIIVWPWDFQDSKADVKHRYNKTQALYLSRKGVLPDAVDVFGLNIEADDFDDEDGLFSNVQDSAAQVEEKEEAPEEESEAPEEEESEAPKEEISEDEEDEDDDDDEIDNLFA
jgi:translation initiation factor 1A